MESSPKSAPTPRGRLAERVTVVRLSSQRKVKVLKGVTAKELFERHPALRREFRNGHLGSPSYYLGTVGHVSEATVAHYVETRNYGRRVGGEAPSPFENGGLRLEGIYESPQTPKDRDARRTCKLV